jgi:hypothetical protein
MLIQPYIHPPADRDRVIVPAAQCCPSREAAAAIEIGSSLVCHLGARPCRW